MAVVVQPAPQAPALRNPQYYAPIVQIERKEKNFFQRIIAWVGSFFCTVNFNRHATRSTHALFTRRIELYQDDPTAAKAVSFVQRFLIGPKKRGLEPSLYQQAAIPARGLMDPVFLDLALHRDPANYIEQEKIRLTTYRIQLIQQTAQEIKRKLPQLSEKCDQMLEHAGELTAQDLRAWLTELNGYRGLAKSKPLMALDEIASLMEIDPQVLDTELSIHYLASLQIHEKWSLKKLSEKDLSKGEVRALEILSQKLAQLGNPAFHPVENMDWKRVARFLESASGNLELNRRLIKYAEAHQHLTISKQALELALDVSYKIAQEGEYWRVMGKVDVLAGRILANQPSTAEERLSLKEIKKVESLARLHEKFTQLAAIGAPMNHQLVPLAARADQFVRQVLARAEQERPLKSGSCIFYDYKNADQYLGWPGGPIRKFIYNYLMPWPLVHTSVGVSHEGENWVSHMYHGHHAFHRRSIGDYSFKSFELDFTKSVSEGGRQILQQKLGDNWVNEVERIYGDICHEMHTNKELLSQFHNPPIRQILAAVSIGYGLFDNHAMEHRPLSKQQICSSFVLNTSLQALVRLEERLAERCNQEPGAALPAGFRFMDLPIRRNRLLDVVLPHQLARKALPLSREVSPPPIIKQILNFHEYEMTSRVR